MSEWIDAKKTPPKDGQQVLAIWKPTGNIPCVYKGYVPDNMYVVKFTEGQFKIPDVFYPFPATYWRPLPLPPELP